MRTGRIGFALVMGSLLLASAGCSAASQDEGVGSNDDALYATGARWPGGWVPVCWGPSTVSRADFANYAQRVRNDVENSWMRVAKIEFAGWGTCGTNTKGWVVVNLTDTADANTSVPIGYNPNGAEMINLGVLRNDFDTAVLHEFGHALGFDHEMARPDFPGGPGGGCVPNPINGGNTLGTDPDLDSIMASTNYCNRNTVFSAWDVAGVQKLYGRKPAGSIVGLGGRCANIAGGTTQGANVIGWPCYGVTNDSWTYYPTVRNFSSVESAIRRDCMNVSGGKVINSACNVPVASEQFAMTGVRWKAMGNMCVTAPSATSHAQLEIRSCGTVPYERWDFQNGDGRIRLSGTSLCVNVPNASATLGNVVQLYPCGLKPYPNEKFEARHDDGGLIRYGNLCFNVLGGKPTSGAKVGLWDGCNIKLQNEQFFVSGTIKSPSGQCMDMTGGASFNGVGIGMYACVSGAANQQWDYYW